MKSADSVTLTNYC